MISQSMHGKTFVQLMRSSQEFCDLALVLCISNSRRRRAVVKRLAIFLSERLCWKVILELLERAFQAKDTYVCLVLNMTIVLYLRLRACIGSPDILGCVGTQYYLSL